MESVSAHSSQIPDQQGSNKLRPGGWLIWFSPLCWLYRWSGGESHEPLLCGPCTHLLHHREQR